MKISFVLFLLLDIPSLKGQQRIEEFEHIVLRLTFPSIYNSYDKYCCKLYPGGCYKLLDSTGYTCDLLRGRVTKTESDGWIEFKISNVQSVDGGYYRCMVQEPQNRVYRDYYVEVSEVLGHHTTSQPSVKTTIKASYTSSAVPNTSSAVLDVSSAVPDTSSAIPDSTGAVLAEDHGDRPRVPWSFGMLLAIIVSIAATVLFTSVIVVVYCRVKAKHEVSDKCGETLHESLKQEAPETSSVVYTTVDFRAHKKPTEVYANLRVNKTQTAAPNSTWRAEHDGMVEYSTLAIHK